MRPANSKEQKGAFQLKQQVGIVVYGVYLPKERMTAKQISEATGGVWAEEAVVEKLGIVEKTLPGEGDTSQEMSVRASLAALRQGDVDPGEIDVILDVTEEWKEYPLTTTATYVQGKIGAVNAWGIDLQNRCCSFCSAVKIAKDMLLADEDVNMALVTGGYRNCDLIDFTDRAMSMMYNLGAGGAAMILKKGHDENLVLGSYIMADGTLARDAGVTVGGITQPASDENIDGWMKLRLMDADHMKSRLNEVSLSNWYRCIDESLKRSGGLTRKDIGYLAILHFKRSQHLAMLKELGLTEEQTIYLENYGHIGQMDQVLSLTLGLEQGKVKDGTLVNMIAAGIGYVWASTCIRWGKT